ncbi:hypothetical protein [Haloplanus halophilus]|uniref:hypothetical protein n=1 Tax=Haloplanus halophilus TaxID=2949993 RepID=UPI0020413697|nr:hypothetical protein [Haloplanus sp. GDY1]
MSYESDLPETSSYSPTAVAISAVGGIALALVSVWWAAGTAVFYEGLFRISPTVDGGGVGTDWVVGNTVPWLDFLIAFIHAADVLMGLFILLMVFVHWGAFRRLAAQMQDPEEERREAVATDGGETE